MWRCCVVLFARTDKERVRREALLHSRGEVTTSPVANLLGRMVAEVCSFVCVVCLCVFAAVVLFFAAVALCALWPCFVVICCNYPLIATCLLFVYFAASLFRFFSFVFCLSTNKICSLPPQEYRRSFQSFDSPSRRQSCNEVLNMYYLLTQSYDRRMVGLELALSSVRALVP